MPYTPWDALFPPEPEHEPEPEVPATTEDVDRMIAELAAARVARMNESAPAAVWPVPTWNEPPPAPVHTNRLTPACTTCGEVYFEADNAFPKRKNGKLSTVCNYCARKVRAARRDVRENGRKFGVEIEFECSVESSDYYGGMEPISPSRVARALRDRGIDCANDGYTHEVYEHEWKIVSDSSVELGWELVSPPLRWSQRNQIVKVCEVLSDLDAEATDQCGLHVHHDVQDLSLPAMKRLVNNWHRAQPMTDLLVARERCDSYSEWSPPLEDYDLERLNRHESLASLRNGCYDIDRYRSLNVQPYARQGTIEIRQHQGTINSRVILAWIAYGQAFIEAARSTKAVRPGPSMPEYLDSLPFACHESRDRLKTYARPDRNTWAPRVPSY